MSEPNKMSKKQYEAFLAAAKRSVKRKNQAKAAKTLKKSFDAEMANRDNERRRQEAKGIKPSGFPMYNKGGYNDPEKLKKMAKSAFNALTGVSGVKAAVSLANRLNGGNVFQRAGYDVSKAAGSAATGAAAGATMGKMTKTVENKPAPTGRMKEIFREAASSGAYSKSKQSLKPKKEKGIHLQGKKIPRITSKPSKDGNEVKLTSYRYGGKVYNDGGRALFNALKKKFGEG